MGEHGLFYKQCSYEGSVGVPLIVKGPGLPSNKVIDTPVTLVDMYPTIMDMAGLDVEPDRPGKSWLPLIRNGEYPMDYAFAEYHGNFFRQSWYMLVKGDYKYTYYVNNRPSLFNIKNDPKEMNDLALDPKYKPVLDEFEKLLRTIVDPEEVSFQSKKDMGLIGPNGEDYTMTLTFSELQKGIKEGIFLLEPEFPGWK